MSTLRKVAQSIALGFVLAIASVQPALAMLNAPPSFWLEMEPNDRLMFLEAVAIGLAAASVDMLACGENRPMSKKDSDLFIGKAFGFENESSFIFEHKNQISGMVSDFYADGKNGDVDVYAAIAIAAMKAQGRTPNRESFSQWQGYHRRAKAAP
jgi:hypothetical protein